MDIVWLLALEEWRDIFVSVYSVAGTVMFIFGTIFIVIVGVLAISTLNRVRRIMKENVTPTLDSVRETSESVRGTVVFISDNAVKPVVKVYGTVAGVRRFIAVFARLARSGREG